MAFDKIIDSAALDANLTQIANAIRSKGGTSAALAFPAGFESAIAAIKTGGACEVHKITFASNVAGSGAAKTLLTGNQFIKDNYAKDGFYVLMLATSPVTAGVYNILGVYHGNRQLANGISASYGFHFLFNSGGTGTASAAASGKVNGSTWNVGFRATSAGKLDIYLPASRNIAAGTYEVCLVCEE